MFDLQTRMSLGGSLFGWPVEIATGDLMPTLADQRMTIIPSGSFSAFHHCEI